jgi:hypothetical protein
MIASSESSGLHDEEYGFRPLTRRQFQSKSINSFNDMKEKKKSGKSSSLDLGGPRGCNNTCQVHFTMVKTKATCKRAQKKVIGHDHSEK